MALCLSHCRSVTVIDIFWTHQHQNADSQITTLNTLQFPSDEFKMILLLLFSNTLTCKWMDTTKYSHLLQLLTTSPSTHTHICTSILVRTVIDNAFPSPLPYPEPSQLTHPLKPRPILCPYCRQCE